MLQTGKTDRVKQFYKHVDELRLKFPVAEISRATGQSKGNVSRYLNGSLEPSEAFLNKFYGAFSESFKEVAIPESNKHTDKLTTSTKAPAFEMKPSNGSDKDAVIKTLAVTTQSQQEVISKLTDLVTKLIKK